MSDAENLLAFLTMLTIIADAADREDAEEMAAFWWLSTPGSQTYLPDGRVLTK